MDTFAVILTHNRPDLLRQTVAAIGPQVDMVIVVDNASDPPVPLVQLDQEDDDHLGLGEAGRGRIAVVQVPDQPPNLSKLWDHGLSLAEFVRSGYLGVKPLRVAFLCDDAPPPVGWFAAVTAAMAETGAAIGCSHPDAGRGAHRVKTAPDRDLGGRMPGWAFVLDPASGVRPDSRFQWWWGDTDLDWQARAAGGMVMVYGWPVPNALPNDFTASKPELAARCGLDRLEFEAKWGQAAPW